MQVLGACQSGCVIKLLLRDNARFDEELTNQDVGGVATGRSVLL
jgi:hypothetical protein